ncbi:MAG TPA: GNAT family protein [Candidatus Sulfopaludibacter sp.]|nr:GNAT family protein [Candidatus Sulfopaludibacter sp.]
MMFHLSVTANIDLKQMESHDAEPVFALTERNRAYLREWLPWVDTTVAATDTRNFIMDALAQFHANRGPNSAIWLDGVIVGTIGCHPIDWANRSCSIGYMIDAGYQGRGIVTRSCARLVDYLFAEMKLHRVVIQCGTGNAKSCAIPERLGFTREGILFEAEWVSGRWVDLIVWSMLEQNWPAIPRA